MIKIGLIGIGAMGRMHYGCYGNNPGARVTALCDVDERKRSGDWGAQNLNISAAAEDAVDLSGVQVFADAYELINNADVDAIDICLPTPLHAPVALAALRAGKHVLCEKPMAWTLEDCTAMKEAAREKGVTLLVGHCLRYWPHYVRAHELIQSGEYGKVLYAKFQRVSETPKWSWDDWLRDGERSGGAVFDMHIHDVDTALWWFGQPDEIRADGVERDGLPLRIDAVWKYTDGPLVSLYGAWDNAGGGFRMAFDVVFENATLAWDSSLGAEMSLHRDGETTQLEVDGVMGYQYEIDDFVDALAGGRPISRVTPAGSRESVDVTLQELRQIRGIR